MHLMVSRVISIIPAEGYKPLPVLSPAALASAAVYSVTSQEKVQICQISGMRRH